MTERLNDKEKKNRNSKFEIKVTKKVGINLPLPLR